MSRLRGGGNEASSVDLKCPVCLKLFINPCFVCPNHHTLCRSCYNNITNPQCPMCRATMTRPVENSHLDRLVQIYKLKQQATCQAKDDSNPCKRLAFQHCDHCSRDMCQEHYCEHRLEFEKSCKQAIANAEYAVEVADSNTNAVIKEWDSLIDESVKVLKKRRSKIRGMISTANPASKLRADVSALRELLNAGDLKEATTTFNRLTETTSNSKQGGGLAGLRPRALVHVELRDAVKDIERLCLLNKESK